MLTPQFQLPVHHELVVDLFAGGGGTSTGLEQMLGRPVDVAINHDPEAVAMHLANHPQTLHYVSDVFEVDPVSVCDGRPVGLLWASPDCFPAGTLVLTRRGYTPIEEVKVGDEVMTHRTRWRRVTETSSTQKPLMRLKGHGHPGIAVSPEHPFLARLRQDVWRTSPRGYERTLQPQDWVPASALDKGWYWATPTTFPGANPPPVDGRGMDVSEDLMWLAGRYLGDGWTRIDNARAELVITCGKHEAGILREKLSVWPRSGSRAATNELAWHERSTDTAYQFSTNHRGLVTWLREHFGHRAESKRVPAWALGMAADYREALIAGYISADGWTNETFGECRTVSKALAFGIKGLLASLGKTVTVHRLENSQVIDGREVNARAIYMLRWRHQVDGQHAQTFREDNLEWCPIREQDDLGVTAEVFNIGVEEDESYVVEGLVVHNCKHFSKAKGGKPVEKRIRGLAWIVIKWAKLVRPRVIMLENVEEFQYWGPLGEDSRPCPNRRGRTFKRWKTSLENLGYQVGFEERRACDLGTPTIRKRLFLVARCDGRPIVFPPQTHAEPGSLPAKAGKLKPWRTAAECIDWSIPCPSIFERERDLADATKRRVAKGIMRYVVNNPRPFIVGLAHGEHKKRPGSRVRGLDQPVGTIHAQGGNHAIVVPSMVAIDNKSNGSSSWSADSPLRTTTTENRHALVAAFLAQHNNHRGSVPSDGRSAEDPMSTVTSKGCQQTVVAAHLTKFHADSAGASAGKPMPTVTANSFVKRPGGAAPIGLVTSNLIKLRGTSKGAQRMDEPLHTISAQGMHHAEVRAFLIKYFGTDQDPRLDEPMHTVTTKHRFGLVTVAGQDYAIADIGLRMLAPRELYRAQGFPESYVIDKVPATIEIKVNGHRLLVIDASAPWRPLTKTAQVRMCGNSVPPPMAYAYAKANYHESHAERIAA